MTDRVNAETSPRLGVVLLDVPSLRADFGRFTIDDEFGLSPLQKGSYSNPQTWPVPTVFARARGANPVTLLKQTDEAIRGFRQALERISGECSLITTDCGFFHRRLVADYPAGARLLLSGLDLIPLALTMTDQHIGVITYSAEACRPLISNFDQSARLKLVGLSDLPTWNKFGAIDFVEKKDWTFDELGSELEHRVSDTLANDPDVGVVVIECTAVPRFLHRFRHSLMRPILDTHSVACALLGYPAPELVA